MFLFSIVHAMILFQVCNATINYNATLKVVYNQERKHFGMLIAYVYNIVIIISISLRKLLLTVIPFCVLVRIKTIKWQLIRQHRTYSAFLTRIKE
jgi:hypothetical protein